MNRRKYDRIAVYDYIVDYKAKNNGNSPSTREIKDKFDISSTSLVFSILKGIEKMGLIDLSSNAGQSRSIIVIGGSWTPPSPLLVANIKKGNYGKK